MQNCTYEKWQVKAVVESDVSTAAVITLVKVEGECDRGTTRGNF